jgi:hypothetical protein
MNNFNSFLNKHGFEKHLIPEDNPAVNNSKELELKIKLLEDEYELDPSLETTEEENNG